MSSNTSSSSRPIYSPSQLLSLQSKAAQVPVGVLPDLACVSTSPTSPSVLPPPLNRRTSSSNQHRDFSASQGISSYTGGGAGAATTSGSSAWRPAGAAGLLPKPIHSISSSSANPVPLFQQTPKPTKVTIRSLNSTSPPTPISPAGPPPVVASPTSPGHSSSSTSSTPLFQQARASRVSIKLPSPKEDPATFGVKSSPTVTRIPGSGGGAGGESRPVIPPSLPSSSSISSSPPSQEKGNAAVDGGSLIDLDAIVEPQAVAVVSPPPARTFGVDDLDLFTSSPAPSDLARATTTTSTIIVPAPQPIPSIMDSPAEELSGWEVPSPSPSSSVDDANATPPSQTLSAASPPTSKFISPLVSPPQSPAPPPPTRATTADDDDRLVSSATIPTPPTSPATHLAAAGTARVQRAAGSTPSGRMIAGALGLSRDRTGGVAGGTTGAGGYVRPEVKIERKLSGKELDDKILKIREENRRIEAEHEKEEVDALVHSPTRSREASVDEQTGLEGGGEEREMTKRASAERRLSQAETEIERLKRELDRAVQTKIDTEREVARERKLKAAGSGSLDWDASKSPTSPDLQSLPFEKQPSPTYFNKPSTSPLASPYERPSRPRFPSDGASPDGRRTSSGSIVVEEEEEDGGWGGGGGKGDATPTRSLTPIANSTSSAASLLTPKPTPVKFKVGGGSSSSEAKGKNLPRIMPDSSGSSGKGSPFLVQKEEEEEASSEVSVGWEVQEGLAGEDEDDGEDEETGGWGV